MSADGEPAVSYLRIALEAAENGQWETAKLNAEEGAKYAALEGNLAGVDLDPAEGRC
jgi:hypothetical protein